MLPRIFLWFYCLTIPRALLVIALATAALMGLHRRFRRRTWWKALLGLGLLAGIGALLAQTLLVRSPGGFQPPVLQPLASYRAVLRGENSELLRSNFMNVALFYPLGLTAALAGCRARHPVLRTAGITAGFFLLSLGIELSQLHWGLGLCEADDVLHNTLGALLGALAGGSYPYLFPDA